MPTDVTNRGEISRGLPQPGLDTQQSGPWRVSRYDEQMVIPLVRKQHAIADEGTYYVVNNNQSAITGQAGTAFSATAATILIANTDSSSNPSARRVYLDYIFFMNGGTAFSNSTSNTGMFWAIGLDNGNRYSSGGTALTANIVSPNIDSAARSSVVAAYCGAVTATAATAAVRYPVGMRLFREPVSGTALSLANMDTWYFNFGGVEAAASIPAGSSGTVQANISHKSFACPPIVIGPGQSFLLYIWLVANSGHTAGTLLPEIGWWER